LEELKKRLMIRGTDSPEMIAKRLEKAEFEMSFAPQFDVVIVNDDLEKAKKATEEVIFNFLEK